MKAITLHQPWASLVALGAKTIETRTWGTQFRGFLAIHSSSKLPALADEFFWLPRVRSTFMERGANSNRGHLTLEDLPLGRVLAVVRLVDVVRIEQGKALGEEVTREELLFGNFAPGRFMWKFEGAIALPEQVQARGAQSLWEWKEVGKVAGDVSA